VGPPLCRLCQMDETTSQLEFFEAPNPGVIRPLITPVGRLEVRHDHAILLGMAGLIGVAVIFAGGVERGKQLARTERVLMAPPSSRSSSSSSASSSSASPATSLNSPEPARAGASSSPITPRQSTPSPKPATAPRVPKRLAESSARFAVQVVSYTKPALAARELSRLQARGESAFLIKRADKAVLFVGPFTSRKLAKDKLAGLKPRYRDCFVRSL